MSKGYGKTLQMYPSTAQFASVYADPFLATSARIPAFPLVASQLTRTYSSSKGVLNVNGNGWITVQPANNVTYDQPAASFSQLSTAADVFQYGGTGTGFSYTDSEFQASDFNVANNSTNRAFRPVALGIRVRNIGTILSSAGTCYTLQMSPKTMNDDVLNLGVADIKKQPGFKEYTFRDDKWHSVTRHITQVEDLKYQGYSTAHSDFVYLDQDEGATSVDRTFDSQYNLGIYMTGSPGQAFEFEVVGHYEIIGPNLARRAIVAADTKGVEHVASSFAKRRHQDTMTKDHSVGVPHSSPGGWIDILKRGAEQLLPMIPSILAMIL